MYGPGRMGFWRGRMGLFGGPAPPALLVIALVVGGLFLFSAVGPFFHFFPFFLFFWVFPFFLVPAFALTARSVARFVEGWRPVDDGRKEKELLEALARHGELTPARAALETTLSVSEADRMLSALAKDGHIEVRAREGRLGYALWEPDRRELTD